MSFNPASFDLGSLFRDPSMFDTSDAWARAGFEILRASDNKITVASHASVPGYLFKKYVRAGKRDDEDDQLANYETRLEGARRLRELIASEGLRYVVVPGKWLRELPPAFGQRGRPGRILVVERLDLLDNDASERAYRRITEDVLRDLCVALFAFRGLDSTAKNVPFTTDGRIALIDTEHWERHSDRKKSKQRPWLKYLGEHLSRDRKKLADEMWKKLSRGVDSGFSDEESTSSS